MLFSYLICYFKNQLLDYEWRNSTASLSYLINKITELNSITDKILFLGMPTLFATAVLKDIPQFVTLVERNEPIIRGLSKLQPDTKRFKIVAANIFSATPKKIGKHYCVVMDPPWYTPHFMQFIWLASQCVEIGGLVAISLPPINTRPKILEERLEWFQFCHKNGLCIENLYSQQLHYAMPFFEFNAFRAAGIKNILPFWRKGDLALFRKVNNYSGVPVSRPKHTESSNSWVEKEVDSVRIRINKDDIDSTTPTLTIENLVKGDILPTVSSRDEVRQRANIFTSGNRIYRVNNPIEFANAIDRFVKGEPDIGKNEIVGDWLNVVTELERKEFNDYLEWLYYEMERQTD